MMYGIEIEDAVKLKCPNCSSIFSVRNEFETLYRNITLLYTNDREKLCSVKCKQCKKIVTISGDVINVE